MKVKVLIEFEAECLVKQGEIEPKTIENIISNNIDIVEICDDCDTFIKPNQDSFQISIDTLTNESN